MDIRPYLEKMVERKASDLFFSTNAPVNIKINGVTGPLDDRMLEPADVRTLAYSLMNEQQVATFEVEREMNMGVSISKVGRFRVNIFRQRGEVAMVIRYMPPPPASFESIGLPAELSGLAMQKQGLVLVAGGTGSGKSTTLAALVDHRNTNATGHILTIEDPIEFIHNHKRSVVHQREVGTDTFSFEVALRNAMREAPDVIMIGEVRDRNTMMQAIMNAETGHLCLATIHATNVTETLDRIINFFEEEYHRQVLSSLSKNLLSIIVQRLVITPDGGRVPALEILGQSPFIRELINKGEIERVYEAMLRHADPLTTTFDESLYRLYKAGAISAEEAVVNADSQHNVELRIRLDRGGSIDAGSELGLSD